MTIEQANEYFSSLPEGFAPAEELRAALTADVQKVQFVGVAGTAGKTAAAGLLAAILREAAFHVGFYRAGCEPLSARIAIGGVSVDPVLLCQAAEALNAAKALPREAAELAAAARCFGAAGCKLAVVELPDAGLASALPQMPVCAVTAIGPDGVSRSVERLAALAAGVMRKDAVCVTAPEQPKAVLSELVVAAAKAECELASPTPRTSPSSRRKSSPARWTTADTPPRWPSWAVTRRAMLPSRSSWHWPSGARALRSPMRPFWRVLPLWRTAAASASCPRSPSLSSTPAVLRSRLQPFCASSIWRKYAI